MLTCAPWKDERRERVRPGLPLAGGWDEAYGKGPPLRWTWCQKGVDHRFWKFLGQTLRFTP